ncbi:hypothetical protein JTB14_021400 [Gonioctena quinquepunctata]|nr:hypothetical protein JTB14_021400 [Gonioctena quinquepunctata]
MGDVAVQQPTFEVSSITTTVVMMARKQENCFSDQCTAFLWNMARFYALGPTPEELVTCLYGMFMNVLPKQDQAIEVYERQMQNIFNTAKIKMVCNYIKTSGIDNGMEAKELLNDTYIEAVKEAFGQEKLDLLFTKPELAYIMCSIILLLSLGYDTGYYSNWFNNNMKELAQYCVSTEIEKLPAPKCQNIKSCNFYLKFDTTFRAEFVNIILRVLPSIPKKFQYTLQRVVQCCEYHDMRHILQIDTYIFGKYEKKLTCLPELQQELALFKKAKTYLNNLPLNERLLCKLTRSETETSLLDIKHFPLLVAVAETCSRENKQLISDIQKKVQLSLRTN